MESTSIETPTLHAIVLAAGAATRFGSPKQLVRIEGRPLLHTVVGRAVEVAGTRDGGARLARRRTHGTPAPHSRVRHGQSRLGRRHGEFDPCRRRAAPASVDGVLLMLADQPCVTAEDLRRLVPAAPAGLGPRRAIQRYRRRPRDLPALGVARSRGIARRSRRPRLSSATSIASRGCRCPRRHSTSTGRRICSRWRRAIHRADERSRSTSSAGISRETHFASGPRGAHSLRCIPRSRDDAE